MFFVVLIDKCSPDDEVGERSVSAKVALRSTRLWHSSFAHNYIGSTCLLYVHLR